jgi:uncharacterized membrane protein
MIGACIALGLAVFAAACVFIIRIQAKRARRYREEAESLRRANREAARRLEYLRRYMAKNKTVTEEAEHERRELEKTPDGGLADRANNLFGGVREPAGGVTGNGT